MKIPAQVIQRLEKATALGLRVYLLLYTETGQEVGIWVNPDHPQYGNLQVGDRTSIRKNLRQQQHSQNSTFRSLV